MTSFSFQLHKIEVVTGKPSEIFGDHVCMFAKDAVIKHVPMLHIFGRTKDGSSVCAKIRNVYPYFFVELPEPYNTVLYNMNRFAFISVEFRCNL